MSTVLSESTQDVFDSGRAAAFEERFVNALNEGGMLLLASLGHRSGLLDLMADGEPVTSAELARRAQFTERYVRFEVRDLGDFDATAPAAAYDLVVTFDAIHDQAHPLKLLKGIRRALKPDGVYLAQYLAQDIHASSHHHGDRDHPLGALLYAVSTMHCMTVSLAQGGEGLGTLWGRERARDHFERAGFGRIEVHQLPHDVQNDYWVLRP